MSSASGHEAVGVSVPANLLLIGEYAVLEEGGLGLALAPDARASGRLSHGELRAAAARSPRVTGLFPGGRVFWPGDTKTMGEACDFLRRELGPLPGDITIDTSAMFTPAGRKRGFGSSAAMTVALCALWSAGHRPAGLASREVADIAVAAHRAAQGGKGSGYDVVTSALGAVVLFTGGERPVARRVRLPWLLPVSVFAGDAAVPTGGAVARYQAWKARNPAAAGDFLERSNDIVAQVVNARSWADAYPLLAEYRELATHLGDEIGVAARIRPPRTEREVDGSPASGAPVFWKAVGAGNELGVTFGAPGVGETLTIADEGIRWE